MSISSISSNSTAQSLSDILAAQLQAAKLRKQAADKQSSTVSTTVQTQDSAEFSPEALQASRNSKISPLDGLVTDGTITKDQENIIDSTLQAAMQSQFATRSQSCTTSTSETDPLDSLVSSGAITQDQADTVKSTLQAGRASQSRPAPPNPLDSLVSDGTITQDQEDAIKEALKAAMESQSSTTTKTDPLASLVANGIITQDQENTIQTTFETARQAYQR